jgi:predicted outer membrane repeat protein
MELLESRRVRADTYTVSWDGNWEQNLRNAVTAANADTDVDTIQFDTRFDNGIVDEIVLTAPEAPPIGPGGSGHIEITQPVIIIGPGSDELVISGGPENTPSVEDNTRIFWIEYTSSATTDFTEISHLTLANAIANWFQDADDGKNGAEQGNGGAIMTVENLLVEDMVFRDNEADGHGGAISTKAVSAAGVEIDIERCIFDSNVAAGSGGAVHHYGGLNSHTALSISESQFVSNRAERAGAIAAGTVSTMDSIEIVDTEVRSNRARYGGGISLSAAFFEEGDYLISRCIINENQALDGTGTLGEGGGLYLTIYPDSQLRIEDTTISNNSAFESGGGVVMEMRGKVEIVNSTISTNVVTRPIDGIGGGVYAYVDSTEEAPLTFAHTTVTNNQADSGAGIYIIDTNVTPATVLTHTIMSGNKTLAGANNNIFGDVNAGASTYNFVGTGNGGLSFGGSTGNLSGDDPKLGPLRDNGGPTFTHDLLYNSGARDAGDPNAVAGLDPFPTYDQRGQPYTRVHNGRIDIGAVENQPEQADTLPKVENVIISSTVPNTYGTNPPYEFDGIVGTKEQYRTVPVGGADQIAVQFSKAVDVESGDLDLVILNRWEVLPGVSDFDEPADENNYTATWTFDDPLPAGHYLLRLRGNSIEDAHAQALDGEWTNPVSITLDVTSSVFPSGNDLAGGDFEFVMTIAPADFNRDLSIDGLDYNAWLFGDSPAYHSDGDATGDGSADGLDYNAWLFSPEILSNLTILADYDQDFDVDPSDEADFMAFWEDEDAAADLNRDGNVDNLDVDIFEALRAFDIALEIALSQ